MNVLITGGYGFIGSHIAERFYKEKHSIFIIDNLSTGDKENINFRHKSLITDIKDDKCETFFKTHSIDIVIHCAAQNDRDWSIEEPVEDSSTNLLGLVNILNLAKKYKVKKFVYCSSAVIYGQNQLNLSKKEEEKANPDSPYALSKWTGEQYCQKWDELYGVSSLIFRLSNVYGPRQHSSSESSIIHYFTSHFLEKKLITIYGKGEETYDFIYVDDVAEAVYRGIISQLSGIYNLSSGVEISIKELVEEIERYRPIEYVEYLESKPVEQMNSSLDNTKIKRELDWVPRYSIYEGLGKVFKYYKQTDLNPKEKIEKKSKPKDIRFLPLIENFVLFAIFLGISNLVTPIVDSAEIWLIYIILSAILFEKNQMIVSTFLAIIVEAYLIASQGRVWTSLFVDNTLLATFTIYLVVGLIISYKIERGKIELQFAKEELSSAQSKYDFLTSIYQETLQVKEEMKEQILRTEDGIGTIYESVKKLDTLEPEALFTGAIHVLEQTLKGNRFAIYLVNNSGFMRLAVKSTDSSFQPNVSIKREPDTLTEKAILNQKIYYNTGLESGEPLFVSPIVQNHQTIAVIICYDIHFNRLTLSYRNLIDVVSRLITSSLSHAYEYVYEINKERFIEGTSALTSNYFQRILDTKRKAFQDLQGPTVKLEILTIDHSADNLNSISSLLRINDHLGYDEDGRLFVLLSNATIEDAEFVIKRFESKSFRIILDQKEEVLHVR
jgi:UDP-glucuronate decarboxylase